MKKYLVFAIMLIVLCACSSPAVHQKAVEDAGYTNVVMTGRPGFLGWFSGCDTDDKFATGFTAKMGERDVNGVVCSGWFTGSHIRLF